MQAAQRRLAVLVEHLAKPEVNSEELAPLDTAASSSATPAPLPYASADGKPSTYARVHGPVSCAPAVWRAVPSVAKEQLTDVLYQKSVREGIAKVSKTRQSRVLQLLYGGCRRACGFRSDGSC
jgi:hypothetical protein